MRFMVAAAISDHYLCAGDELSSSARAIHPGERCRRGNGSAAQLLGHSTRRQFSDLPSVVRFFDPEGGDRHVLGCDSVGGTQCRQGPARPTHANYNRPSSRARLTAALRCSTRSLRYTARWWVFTVLSETYSRSPISRRDNRVARRRRTSSALGVSSSPTTHPSLREVSATLALRSAEASSVEAMPASGQPRTRVPTSSRMAFAVWWSPTCSKISALTNSALATSRIAPPWRGGMAGLSAAGTPGAASPPLWGGAGGGTD